MNSYKFWKNNDALEDTITTIDRDKKDQTSLNILTSASGNNSLLTVVNGGHTWPGADDFNIGLPAHWINVKRNQYQRIYLEFFRKTRIITLNLFENTILKFS